MAATDRNSELADEPAPGFRWPLSLRVGSVFAGIGVGCGVGVGFGKPIVISPSAIGVGSLPSAPQLPEWVPLSSIEKVLGRVGLKGGLGCGLGVGYGFGVGFAVKPSAVNGVSQFFAESVARIKHRIISQVDCESSQSLAGDNSRIDMAATESAGSASLSPFQGGHCSDSLKSDKSAGPGKVDSRKTALEHENVIMAALLQAQIDIQELRAEVNKLETIVCAENQSHPMCLSKDPSGGVDRSQGSTNSRS